MGRLCRDLAHSTLTSRYLKSARSQRELRDPLGKESFAWVKKDAPFGLSFVTGADGRLTANLAEVDALVRRSWDPVLRMYAEKREPEFAPFFQEYKDFITQHNLNPITAERLRQVAKKKSVQTSCGVDGWRMREIAALPNAILESFVVVLNEVEETGFWPDGVLDAMVTLIPKGEGSDPLKLRPITVSSVVYRLWASVRLQDVMLWQELWIHGSQHGFRHGHSCDDVVMDIALSIEESLTNGTPLCGVALDFAKCFDRVPQALVLDLMEALGLHERVLAPLRHIYKHLRRRFRYPLGVGEMFTVTNGILQGCPISVVLINALLSVLSKALVSRARVSPKSFADDLYLLSQLARLLQEGIRTTEVFDSLTGFALNEDKSVSFSTSPEPPRLVIGRKIIRSSKIVKVLGVPLGTEGPVDNRRANATVEAAARLEAAPLMHRTKFRIMQTIAASAYYGAAYCTNTTGGFVNSSTLRTALSACVIPRSNRAKSPLAVLSLVAKAHLCDPACASGFSLFRTFVKQYGKERFRVRMDALLRVGADSSIKGPVGLMANLLREIRFLRATQHSFQSLSFDGTPVSLLGKEAPHLFREGLRLRAWRYLTTQRQGFDGIEGGVDVRAMNRLWLNRATDHKLSSAISRCIGGAVYSREWCRRKWGSGSGDCEFCDSGATGTLWHYYWQCPGPGCRWNELRSRFCIAEAMVRDMPQCLCIRGIPPYGTPPDLLEKIQRLIGTISIEMAQAQRSLAATRPWELASGASTKYDVHLATDSRKLLTTNIGTRFAATLVFWLRSLSWVSSNPLPTTGVELALDFEAFTRSKLPGRTFAEKGLQIGFSVSMVRHDLNSNYNRIAELEADVERARVKEMEWAHMEDELEILRTELHAEKQKVRNLQKNQKDYAQLAEQAADREERLTQEMRENAKAAKEIERLRRELEQARQLAEEQQRAADELRARIDALAAEAAAAGAAPPLRTAAETSSQPKEAAPQPQLTSSSASFAAVAAGGDAAEAPVTVQVEGGGIDLTIRVAQLQKMLTEKTIENERLRLCGIDHAKGVERIKSLKVANRKLHEQFAARVERERETRLELQTEPVSKSLDEIIVGGLELRRDYLSLKHGVSSGKASTAFSASGAFSPRYTSNDETHHNLTFCTSTSRLTALRERSIEVPDSISPGVASHVPAYKNA
ncbi:Retrovirus-related Pol polyprotein from type-2 retrotransposable element R2DM [Diplonema papillatum]|nr:Retrovirus-related Pol polyprotein from type-2 retrotransposable element R2DM [Diplonema papillatum]